MGSPTPSSPCSHTCLPTRPKVPQALSNSTCSPRRQAPAAVPWRAQPAPRTRGLPPGPSCSRQAWKRPARRGRLRPAAVAQVRGRSFPPLPPASSPAGTHPPTCHSPLTPPHHVSSWFLSEPMSPGLPLQDTGCPAPPAWAPLQPPFHHPLRCY